MHPDLSAHLHTPECNELIKLLQDCHENHKIRKFIGYCNVFDHQVAVCLKKERLNRRQKNYEKALERKNKIRALAQQNSEN